MAPTSDLPNRTHSKQRRTRVDVGGVLTHAMEDYIKVIYKILQQEERATTIRVAGRLGLSAASVTNMLQKLARLGLVQYTPYQGARLTATGERIALEIIRHHRLLELYLAEHMGYSWDEVDAEAEELEHVISHEFASRMDRLLGYPDTDPHGDPIPTREGRLSGGDAYMSLAEAEPGQDFVIRRVSDDDPEVLRYLGDLGLYPGCRLHVADDDAVQSRMRVRVDGEERDLDLGYASHVYVEPAGGPPTTQT